MVCAVPDRAAGAPRLSGACPVRILPGTRLFDAYGREESAEEFFCNYEVNERYRGALEASGLRVSAVGPAGEVRAVELSRRRFFVATLFQPQLAPPGERPHPVLAAYLRAVTTSSSPTPASSRQAGRPAGAP